MTSYELSNLLKVTVEIVLIRSSIADKFRRGKATHRKGKKVNQLALKYKESHKKISSPFDVLVKSHDDRLSPSLVAAKQMALYLLLLSDSIAT